MKVIHGLESPELSPTPRVVAMGAYDGVHRGHQMLLKAICEAAAAEGLESTALTFEPIPLQVLSSPERQDLRLTTEEEKLELLERQCLDTVVVAPFDEQFRGISARDFAADILAARLGTRVLLASETHTFGHGGEADVAMMGELGREFGFEVRVLPLFGAEGGEHISSSRIRALLWGGHVEEAAQLLGRPYSVHGGVVTGHGRGRHLGFPTANLDLPAVKLVPADGVYACLAAWEGQPEPPVTVAGLAGAAAAVSIGLAPTFGEGGRLVEAYILDESPELLGLRMELHFIARLREQRRFSTADDLSDQISWDVGSVRQALSIDNGG